jgi:hypothetical protein
MVGYKHPKVGAVCKRSMSHAQPPALQLEAAFPSGIDILSLYILAANYRYISFFGLDPESSFAVVTQEALIIRAKANERLTRLCYWLLANPGLSALQVRGISDFCFPLTRNPSFG